MAAASALDFPGQLDIVTFAAILEWGVLWQLALDGQPKAEGDAPLMGSNYKDLFFTFPALVEIAAIVPREHFRWVFDFYSLGFEVFVDIHIILDIDRVSQQFRDKRPFVDLYLKLTQF